MSSPDLSIVELAEVVPLLRRMVALDPRTLVRIRRADDRLTALVRTPFDVLAARSIRLASAGAATDVTLAVGEALAWIDGETMLPPTERDAEWRGPVPPETRAGSASTRSPTTWSGHSYEPGR